MLDIKVLPSWPKKIVCICKCKISLAQNIENVHFLLDFGQVDHKFYLLTLTYYWPWASEQCLLSGHVIYTIYIKLIMVNMDYFLHATTTELQNLQHFVFERK